MTINEIDEEVVVIGLDGGGRLVIARAWDRERGHNWVMVVTKRGRRYLIYGASDTKTAIKSSGKSDLEETVRHVAYVICRVNLAESVLDQLEDET